MLSKCIAVLKEKMKREVWNDFDRILDRGGKAYMLCMMGDLNGSVGKRERVDMCFEFGVSAENQNRRSDPFLC